VRSQIKLGRILGIKIGLHYSWFVIAFLIVISLSAQFRISNPRSSEPLVVVMALGTGMLFFVCLLPHELSHSLFAKSQGIPVREITLFALGGVSQIEKNPTSAKSEFWMAFVGPLTSAVLGAACLAIRPIVGHTSSPVYTMVSWLGYINLGLAAFNMVPGTSTTAPSTIIQ
jgi:Zn-dependent protease